MTSEEITIVLILPLLMFKGLKFWMIMHLKSKEGW